MKAVVDPDLCTACGTCVDICSEVFQMGETIAAVRVNPVPAQFQKSCREACEACPVEAIALEE